MVNSEILEEVFGRFIADDVSSDSLQTIKESVTLDDVAALLRSVESLGDPSEYCKDDYDTKTPAGYFLYIDFISALIINLGDSAAVEVAKHQNTRHPFVKWVVQFVSDERFHEEITSKFGDVFT